MELNDLNKITRSNKLNNLLNTRFGFDFDLSKMNETIAKQMLNTANREMSEIAESSGDYQVNKKYLMSKLVKETIEAWQVENNLNVSEAPKDDNTEFAKGELEPGDGKIEPQQNSPQAQSRRANALRLLVGPQNYMKAKRALDMYKKGQTVPPTLMTGLMPIIDMIDEIMSSNLANVRFLQMVDKRARKQLGIKESVLKEGEMESAELVLASKDMVDRIQSMLEDVSEMQAEDLLPLTDQIRDEMGNEKAEAFMNAAKGSLESLLDAITTARSDMDNASRILTGTAEESGTDLTAEEPEAEEPTAEPEDTSTEEPTDDVSVDLDAGPEGQEGVDDLDRQERP
jgi:hypothetical protein